MPSQENSRQLVLDTLAGKNTSRAPRQLWWAPYLWPSIHHPSELAQIQADFPDDIIRLPAPLKTQSPRRKGDSYEIGEYTDDFGATFINIQRGVFGEVKQPLVTADDWSDSGKIHIPREWLSFDIAEVNTIIRQQHPGKFIVTEFRPRPFEQLQFLRGSENLLADLACIPPRMHEFIERLHAFYCEVAEKWMRTDVDALFFLDDWGSQNTLLVNPALWREIFKPMYRDFIAIARKHGKKAFMHCDGFILPIMPDLIEIGLDAINVQILCMGVEQLKPFARHITFWGEVDRQFLSNGTPAGIAAAVTQMHRHLYHNGHAIAQCEFGAGAKPENVRQVFQTWNDLTSRA